MSLIIPMLVEAYLSDGIDVESKRVPQVSPDYSAAMFQSFLGSKNTPVPVFSMLPPLKKGVHLHFILPDAFKKADDEGKFPAVPDCYIVTRILSTEGKTALRQWVVESSFISTKEQYAGNVSIPMFSDKSETKFRYLGRSYPIQNPPEDEGEYLEELTAVGGGDPMFAAYYPSCYSVFGFHDPMDDVSEGAEAAYFVTGYFKRTALDPFNNLKAAEQFKKKLAEMKLSVKDSDKVCKKILLFGVVKKIKWTNGTIIDPIPEGNIDVAVGRTSAEALSAVAEKLLLPGEADFQRLFTALQYSEADRIDQIDGQYLLDDEIIFRQFQRISGTNGTYVLNGSDEENEKTAEHFAKILGDKLKLGEKMRLCESERKKLFCLWEQYMLLYEEDKTPREPSREDIFAEIRKVADHISALKKQISVEEAALKEQLTEIMSATGEEPFYVPKEPVVLLCGDGIKRNYAFGENGRYTNDGTLACQTSVLQCNVEMDEILHLFSYEQVQLLPEYEQLLVQALLLVDETKEKLCEKFGPLTISGEVSPFAINDAPQEFVTLFMDWQLLFYPLRTSEDTENDNTLSHCSFSYGETDLTTEDPIGSRCITYFGRAVLTPHAVVNLKQRVIEWIDKHGGDEAFEKVAELLDTLPVISQNLGGLNDGFSAMMQAYQFPIIGCDGDEEIAKIVAENIADTRNSVLTNYPLFPLSGGYFRISLINIVGTFGQIQQVYVPSSCKLPDTVYGESVKSSEDAFGYLSPGFVIPSRIAFRWLWKEGKYSCGAGSATPVEGFFVPEMLNNSLTVYDIDGNVLGRVKTVKRNGETQARWVSAPGLPVELAQVSMSEVLKKFLTSIVFTKKAFVSLLEVMDRVLEKTMPDKVSLEIWGKTFALSKAEAALEFYGNPDFTKGFSEFGKYNTLGAESIKIPLAIGDVCRSSDGLIGVFRSDQFDHMYPPFGMEGKDSSGYIEYGKILSISNEDGKVPLYLFAEVSAGITIQTGMHPVKTVKLEPVHEEKAGELALFTDVHPVITEEGKAELPAIEGVNGDHNEEEFLFEVIKKDTAEYWNVKEADTVLKNTIICEGCLTKMQKGDRLIE